MPLRDRLWRSFWLRQTKYMPKREPDVFNVESGATAIIACSFRLAEGSTGPAVTLTPEGLREVADANGNN